MKKKLLALVVAAMFGSTTTRAFTKDSAMAFPFRMGAGVPGDVNRTHPVSIEPNLIDSAAPPPAYGQPVLAAAANAGVRPFAAGDAAVTSIYGMTVRPFPLQQSSGSNYGAASFGSATPPTSGVIDVMRTGYILVQLNDITATPAKGDPVFVWCAVTSGAHIQGGIEVTSSGGSTAALDTERYMFNGPPDANGVCEIVVNP